MKNGGSFQFVMLNYQRVWMVFFHFFQLKDHHTTLDIWTISSSAGCWLKPAARHCWCRTQHETTQDTCRSFNKKWLAISCHYPYHETWCFNMLQYASICFNMLQYASCSFSQRPMPRCGKGDHFLILSANPIPPAHFRSARRRTDLMRAECFSNKRNLADETVVDQNQSETIYKII